jgi:hypothetical protein
MPATAGASPPLCPGRRRPARTVRSLGHGDRIAPTEIWHRVVDFGVQREPGIVRANWDRNIGGCTAREESNIDRVDPLVVFVGPSATVVAFLGAERGSV